MKKFIVMDCSERNMEIVAICDTEQEAQDIMNTKFWEYFTDHNGREEDKDETWGEDFNAYWSNLDNIHYDICYQEIEDFIQKKIII